MSDSDDTDVLLLIPPDLFLVPSSSESDASSDLVNFDCSSKKSGVISELVEHMQTLESRIFAIESKDNSLDTTYLSNSLETHLQTNSVAKSGQTFPRTRFSMSENPSLQNTPIKPCKSLSLPSTPNCHSLLKYINCHQNDMKLENQFSISMGTNSTNANEHNSNKHDCLTSQSSMMVPSTACNVGFTHVTVTSSGGDLCSNPVNCCRNTNNIYDKSFSNQLHSVPSTSTLLSTTEQPQSRSKPNIQEMELSEVDELLQEMEATELELSKRINRVSMHNCIKEQNGILSNEDSNSLKNEEYSDTCKHSISRKLEFESQDSNHNHGVSFIPSKKKSDIFADISLPNDSFHTNQTDKLISEFKIWEKSMPNQASKTEEVEGAVALINVNNNDKLVVNTNDVQQKRESVIQQTPLSENSVTNTNLTNVHSIQTHPVHKKLDIPLHSEIPQYNSASSIKSIDYNALHLSDPYQICQQNGSLRYVKQAHVPLTKSIAHVSTNTDFLPRKSQRLLSLSDFWENNGNKTQEEIHRIKLEEEKFRREHCEHLIQELQKRLLEQQEKVAVALRVDNEKNQLIAQFHNAWSKLKQRVHLLENEYDALQKNLKNVTEKHQLEISEFQSQIKRCESELSKALDLAAGYKEKCDAVMKEKIELLKNHADELESSKLLVQEAESRYEKLKIEYTKLLEKNKQTEEALKSLQQELGKERLKGGEVRNEMDVIHKALDTCEAELTVLRQEKESLQLKLKEENNRNSILQQKNTSLLSALDDVRKAEKLARDETKFLGEQKEKIRSEMQEIYQKQVDEVVKVKLQEFQTQLDAAESEFLKELKNRQQVIAECAARKIKDIMDKHQLEISLLEEKHKEEKRLCELQLAEALQKTSFLELQLNSQRATKSQLAEQLHSVMQKQWQQALQIISGGNIESLTPLQKIHAEKLFESRGPKKSESMPNCYSRFSQEPTKLTSRISDTKNFRDQHECMNIMTSINDTPLTSRKESKDELRKYVKMIAEMQQTKEEFPKFRESIASPPLECREVPRKYYLKKESSIKDEDSIAWQSTSETAQDTSEFMSIPQKVSLKGDQQKMKPPWK